jgi:hypothetical protein
VSEPSEWAEWVSEWVSVNYLGMDVMSSSCLLLVFFVVFAQAPNPKLLPWISMTALKHSRRRLQPYYHYYDRSFIMYSRKQRCPTCNPNNTGICVTDAKNGTERNGTVEGIKNGAADTIRTLQATTREVWRVCVTTNFLRPFLVTINSKKLKALLFFLVDDWRSFQLVTSYDSKKLKPQQARLTN